MLTGAQTTDIDGSLPEGWETRPLGDLATVTAGGTPNRSNPSYWNGDIPWITTSQLARGRVRDAAEFITDEGLRNSQATLLPKGSLLLALYGQGKTRGKVAVLEIEATTNQACAAIVALPGVSAEYLFQYLTGRYDEIRRQSNTGNQDNLTSAIVRSIDIVVPRYPEQHAIAQVLSDVDRAVSALDKQIVKKRAVKQGAVHQLLRATMRLPGYVGPWTRTRLSEIGRFSKGRGIRKDDVSDGGIGCIRYGELYTRYGIAVVEPVSRISPVVAASAHRISTGDILFAGSGETADEIGKCVAYLGRDDAYAGGDIVVHRPVGQDSLFLAHLLNHESVARQKARLAQGDAVVHISATSLGRLEFELPPLDEQKAIATVLSDMDAEITVLKRRREKYLAIKQGMMQALLTGRIRLVDHAAAA